MVAKKSVAKAAPKVHVTLPQSITSEEVIWPGHAAGNGARNSGLRKQLIAEVETMDYGSVRRYPDLNTDAEQNAFLTLFRSVVKNAFNDQYGVQAVKQDGAVIVKIADKVVRARKAK